MRARAGLDKMVTACARVAGALFVLICAVTIYEIFARYMFSAPTTWSIDISIYSMFWACFLGGAYTLRVGGHVAVDVLLKRSSDLGGNRIRALVYGMVALFMGVVMWQGVVACLDAHESGEETMSVLRFPLYVPLSAIPIGGALVALQSLAMALDAWRGAERGEGE